MTQSVWRVECEAPDCSGEAVAALFVSASNSVFVRSATDEEQKQSQGAAAFVVASGSDVHFNSQVARINVDATTGLRTLNVGSLRGFSSFEIVLVTSRAVQSVKTVGSGRLALDDHVLSTSDSISLSVSGSGDLFVASSDVLVLSQLDVVTEGSGDVYLSWNDVRAGKVEVTTAGSGDITVFTDLFGVSSSASFSSSGSGNLCWAADRSLEVEQLEVYQISSGDVSINSNAGPGASCDSMKVQAVGSGDVDIGSVRCKVGNVEMFGSSDVTVQVSDSLTGQTIGGSGSVRYVGSAPQSIARSYFGGYIASPAKSSYKSAVCKHQTFPVYRHDSSILINPANGAPISSAGPSPSDAAPLVTDAAPLGTVDHLSPNDSADVPPGTVPPSPDSNPFVIDKHHLDALLPLGAAALIAALALWKFNSNRVKRRQESGWYGPHGFNQGGNRDEQQPLVGEHKPVYI